MKIPIKCNAFACEISLEKSACFSLPCRICLPASVEHLFTGFSQSISTKDDNIAFHCFKTQVISVELLNNFKSCHGFFFSEFTLPKI